MNIKREMVEKITIDFTPIEKRKITEVIDMGEEICFSYNCNTCPFAIINDITGEMTTCTLSHIQSVFHDLMNKSENGN